MRALAPEQVLKEAQAIDLAPDIRILESGEILDLEESEIVLPEDEIFEEFAKRYLGERKIIWDTTFLRWGSMKAQSKDVPEADRTISETNLDNELIARAAKNAEKSPDWWRQVGSLAVKDGTVILEGYNQHFASPETSYIEGDPRSSFNAGERIDLSLALHGEAGLIAEAAKKGISLDGASIYVTTFPCPNCARMIVNAGLKKIYYKDGYALLNAMDIFKQADVELIKVIEKASS